MPFILVTLCCTFAALGSFLFGYDSGIISSSIQQDAFQTRFGSPGLSDAASGGIISSYIGAAIVGSLLAPYISDSYGRRTVLFLGGLLATFGAALQGGSITIAMLIAGRFISGFAIGMMSATIPVYCSEVAPPRIRGLLASMQQWMFALGILVAQWVGYGCSLRSGDFSWRLPLALQVGPAFILTCSGLSLPESPRWLVEVGKDQEGRSVLTRLHLNRSGTNNPLVEQELLQIHHSVSRDKLSIVRSWHQLFTSSQWRHRVFLACGLQVFAQLSGASVIQSYGPRLFKTLSLSTPSSLELIGIWGALTQLWYTMFMSFADKIGRRKLLIPSLLGMGVVMCIAATLLRYFDVNDNPSNEHALKAAIVMVFVFSFCYTALGLISWVYPSEIFPTTLRARGSSLSTAANWSLNLILTQCSPIAFRDIGAKYLYCFVCFNWAAALIVWLWYPETVGYSLEEIEDVFSRAAEAPAVPPAEETQPVSPSRSHLRHNGIHPLSMHPTTSASGSSNGGSSPKMWSEQTDEV